MTGMVSAAQVSAALTAMADRIITVKSGTVRKMELNDNIVPVEEIEW